MYKYDMFQIRGKVFLIQVWGWGKERIYRGGGNRVVFWWMIKIWFFYNGVKGIFGLDNSKGRDVRENLCLGFCSSFEYLDLSMWYRWGKEK